MTMSILKVYYTTNHKLAELPVIDGQLIFTRDTNTIYLDLNGVRLAYTDIRLLPTDQDRLDTLDPVEGFYYVEETAVLWRFKEQWIQITPSNLSPLYFGGIESFPTIGRDNTLYVADDATYRWDKISQSYKMVSNLTQWTSLEEGN